MINLGCGVKPAGIVGGSAVTPYSLPWQVALVRRGSSRPFCGGTLISPRHVLTAAHCVNSQNFGIIVGEHSYTNSSDGTRQTVCRAINHPEYNLNDNDLSIVHLQNPVEIGTRVAVACLPSVNLGGDFLAGKNMTVSGWGAASFKGDSRTELFKADVPGITNSECNAMYHNITDSMLCAGDIANGGIDACQGDSGGMYN